MRRDVAIVLSGGGINGVLMELGFLKRVRESSLWPRVGWVYGTSAGAFAGAMAALDRLPEFETFLLGLKPNETFRPNRLWRLPLLGLYEYALPDTIAEKFGDLAVLAEELRDAEVELVVIATDATPSQEETDVRDYELVYSSRRTEPKEMAQAILASAAISALVLPVPVGDRVATDGAWVRNFPLTHAYAEPRVAEIVAFRYVPRYPHIGAMGLARLRQRLAKFGRVPPIRAFVEELRLAEERDAQGLPAHLPEMIMRLTRAAIVRNTVVEERGADERDQSIEELRRLREDVTALIRKNVRGENRRARLEHAIAARFEVANFPFSHQRAIPRITVRGSVAEVSLEPGFRDQKPWTVEAKQALIDRGYRLADDELGAAGVDALGAIA
jgi:Predicted esterase of the alpha-beta hydrolase superfamily